MASYSPASIVTIGIILPLLALIAVILRFYLRLYIQSSYIGIDDCLIVAAVILVMADGANLAVGATIGIQGRNYPEGEVPYNRSLLEAKSDYAQVILEKPLYGMMKLSVLFFYRRIFIVQERFRVLNDIMIALITAWTVSFFFAEIFICGAHPKVQWSNDPKDKTCDGQTWLNLCFSITDVIGDILVVSMPLPCINMLQLRRREKIGLFGIFFLGTLSTVCSFLRLGFIAKAFHSTVVNKSNKHSAGTPPAVWSSVEAAVGVLAACLPPLGPLIRQAPDLHKASASIVNKIRSKSRSNANQGISSTAGKKCSEEHLAPKELSQGQDLQEQSGWDSSESAIELGDIEP